MMKAWVLHGIGDIRYEDVEQPQPQDGEVLVRVCAAGVCGSDIPRIYRDGAHRMPLIPGHEFAGEVAALGAGADSKWLRRRVGVFPLIPCRECVACRKMRYEMCRHYSYLGSRRDGGFAEYVTVPERNLLALPDSVSYEQAAMLEPMAVAVHAMRRVTIKPSDAVAVCGVGTIGMLLVMFLMEMGVEHLCVIGNKEAQRERLLAMGLSAEDYCDARGGNVAEWLRERTEQSGADVFFECVGRNETVSQALELAAPGGSVCLVGNPYTDMTLAKDTYWKILRNQLTVTGTWNSAFEGGTPTDWEHVLERLAQGRIAPERYISHRFPLEDLEKGLRIMRDKSEDYLKVMAEI